ncbi:NAD(P)/FAD-dependent oxidoreductase [Mycobacterium ulcerans]|uniref:FAD-containing monooxygenase EthA n=1 Tax=Mycobacterium ulcerans (strain Agy99) TaxID=362242 RepID=A0PX32_MYCUA|nr:NAD(P)/FAD-dependent oxidoreductase [Mycobacterium ulcerans]ABL06901.1 monooxygenase EthA [Mycobacterium ulcerans Agy99]MEB3904350.1 NAD(P)/FAD-dependent oxidoreductase [Mycobacterium ulcerans]MEB3908491.1 NAD(P)/FAD-dependent oxidoreductase [Mycobacterium ulcerans]MEB3918789.1 NAD(P)/FAD-dependent oxidoreductase [Mycobacterium ulcerans]MEB3922882.1 NAD(P)/FAD-dependent oxidoreductase [Mycobacterium ulcerans]
MTEHLDVVIVGAGISGVSAAWHLQDRCPTKSYAILEKRAAMGGTWELFRYPGIRSDSDMHTLGFRFRPWTERQAIADGKPILEYVKGTAAMYGIDKHIRLNQKVISADWSNAQNRWTLQIESNGAMSAVTCSFLFLCSGYYNYDQGYTPNFAGAQDFAGSIIHPQHWPEDLDYDGKNVVVIGSGASAVTLVPALANSGAKHVTMLQRSPTYIVSQPERDSIAERLNRWLPENMAYAMVRWKNVLRQAAVYGACRKWPRRMRKNFMGLAQRQLPEGYDVRKHFGPHYNPWDQRLCLVPNGDLFRAIRHGQVDVVTDTIDRFTPTGIRLNSGQQLPADIIVTATGLNLQLFGGAAVTVDGESVDLTKAMAYKGMMLSGLPNMAYTVGYTNASWTLKADLVSEFVCRLLNYMDANDYESVVVERPGSDVQECPFMEFTPGYVLRVIDELPKQGSRKPWRLNQDYLRDIHLIRRGKIDDEGLRFAKKPVAVPV